MSLFEEIFTYNNLYQSGLECCKNNNWKPCYQYYNMTAWYKVAQIYKSLHNKTWTYHPYHEFIVHDRGKDRNIKALTLEDRIVHKCLCNNYLTPLLSKSLVYDCGATVKGKGLSFAQERLENHLHKFYREFGNSGYVLKVDIHSYFESIDHNILFSLLEEKIEDTEVMTFTKYLISQYPGGKGLGLGSQISQLCGLFYLNKLDHYIKEKLKIKYYGRYMDDMYLLFKSKYKAQKVLNYLNKELQEKYKLELNKDKTKIIKLSHGFIFCKTKYILTDTGKILKLLTQNPFKKVKKKIGLGLPLKDLLPSFDDYISRFNCHKRYIKFKNQYINNLG